MGRHSTLILVNYHILDSCYHHYKVTISARGLAGLGQAGLDLSYEREMGL